MKTERNSVSELSTVVVARRAPWNPVFEEYKERPLDIQGAAKIMHALCRGEKVKIFVSMMLDYNFHLIGYETISVGTATHITLDIRDIFASAIACRAKRVIVGHGHLIGSCQPQDHDFEMTQKIVDVASSVGIQAVDHIIVYKDEYCSMATDYPEAFAPSHLKDCQAHSDYKAPTRTIKELAAEALAVQDACNLTAVSSSFARSMGELAQHVPGTFEMASHPISRVWSDKISSLTRTQALGNSVTAKAFADVERMANRTSEEV